MDVYGKLKELGLTLPEAPAKGGVYTPCKLTEDGYAYISGCGPVIGGVQAAGKLGQEYSVEEGQKFAQNCMLNVLAVLENIISVCMDTFGWSRKKAALINGLLLAVLSLPCVLGFNLWSGFQPLGAGSTVLDGEDFIVSNLLLPIGSLIYLLFCVTKWGWGFDKYLEEANAGKGICLPRTLKPLLQFVLPILIVVIIVQGLI